MEPEPGDLIEIPRGLFKHWAVYIGDGFIIHLVPTDDSAKASSSSAKASSSSKSVNSEKATVKEEELLVVVGNDEYHINNQLDANFPPKSPSDIVKEAKSLVGQEQSYSLFEENCEHFVTKLRYGKPMSLQVHNAVCVAGVAIAAATILAGGSKEKNKQ